jgi:hypothetical protein
LPCSASLVRVLPSYGIILRPTVDHTVHTAPNGPYCYGSRIILHFPTVAKGPKHVVTVTTVLPSGKIMSILKKSPRMLYCTRMEQMSRLWTTVTGYPELGRVQRLQQCPKLPTGSKREILLLRGAKASLLTFCVSCCRCQASARRNNDNFVRTGPSCCF